MKLRLLYIEDAGSVYLGYGRSWPELKWDPQNLLWRAAPFALPMCTTWGELVTPAEAERLRPGCSATAVPERYQTERDFSGAELAAYRPELFDGYDGPQLRASPEELQAAAERAKSIVQMLKCR